MKYYNKYSNKKIIIDGIKFDSKKEAKRYQELKLLERAGKIKDLKLQQRYVLQEGFTDNQGIKHREITYTSDFEYKKDNGIVVEDVKGFKTEVYKIKKKLFLYKYCGCIFKEI